MIKQEKVCKNCRCIFERKRNLKGKLSSPWKARKFCSKSCARIFKATTHGMSHTPTHNVWLGIKSRCSNKNMQNYYLYGGRGISVCKRWMKFENFLKDMGKRPKGMTIERKNFNRGYTPSNCIWASIKDQANNKRSNIFITYKGERKTIKQWAESLGIKYTTLWMRITYYKWSVKKSLTWHT
jgi:hypothetical protein